jgi:hypothetical protein
MQITALSSLTQKTTQEVPNGDCPYHQQGKVMTLRLVSTWTLKSGNTAPARA